MEAQQRLEPTIYEAEWAYLPDFDDLGKKDKNVNYAYEAAASGKTKVGFLGGRPENYAEWKEVYSEKGGTYDMTITYFTAEDRSLVVDVNGEKQTIEKLNSGGYSTPKTITIQVNLKPGNNVIRMGRSDYWAPDIDCFTLTPQVNPTKA